MSKELPKLNVDLLERAIGFAEKTFHEGPVEVSGAPTVWKQASWGYRWIRKMTRRNEKGQFQSGEAITECGTSCCIAGFALIADGQAAWREYDYGSGQILDVPEMVIPYSGPPVETDGSFVTAGAAVLGLTDNEASELFAGENDLPRVKQIARRIAERRNEHIEI